MLNFISDTTDRLDKFLANKIAGVSRGKIQQAIKNGLVLVNNQINLETDFKIHENDKIELPEFGQEKLEILDLDLKIAFQNQDLIVIDKPAGLVVHPAAGHKQDTLVNALINKFPEVKNVGPGTRPGIVHRLDEDTSGLIVVAKNQISFDYLKNLFQTRAIQKEYLTLVHGHMSDLRGIIDTPIGKTSTHQKMRVGVGRPAMTEYKVLDEVKFGVDQFSLLRVKLHTGRTHQIRVHLSSIGNPVVGDQLYGAKFKQTDSKLIDRQFLHAYKLKFKLMDGTWLGLTSVLPQELKQALLHIGISYDDAII